MDSDHSRKDADLEVTGISRSGRVRKKSSKLMDFESPDEIEPRYRKVAPPRSNISTLSNNSQHNSLHDSDTNNFSDEKSENEDILGEGSSDSDYYDPTLEHHDSLDSTDSEDAMISDNESNLNSSLVHRPSRSLTRSASYLIDKSGKRKIISKDGSFNKSNNSQSSFMSHSSNQQNSSSRNIQYSMKTSPYSNNSVNSNNQANSSNNNGGIYRVVGVGPLEVGAHLRLLGESLAIIGERLKEHEGQIAVSGSVSVLLDTLLCSLAPLICLTANLPSIAPPLPLLQDTLDNIAYIMPGL